MTNAANPLDVNNDSEVSAVDALVIINELNGVSAEGEGVLPSVLIVDGPGSDTGGLFTSEGDRADSSIEEPWTKVPPAISIGSR